MKKTVVIMLCVLAVLAIVSCKNELNNNTTPVEEEYGGTLTVRPAEGATFSQDEKFQFKMAVSYESRVSIEFKLKCSEDITGVEVREGGNGDTFFVPKGTALSKWDRDDDGWYIISIPEESVTPAGQTSTSLGITARLPNTNRSNCFVEIKNLKIDDELFDFTDYIGRTSELISAYATSPDNLDVSIED